MHNIVQRTLLFSCISIFCLACLGSKGAIKIEEVDAPMSMSPYLYGENGESLSVGNGLELVDSFLLNKAYYGILYSNVGLSNDKDLSEKIQKRIKDANGDGIINLHFIVENDISYVCCLTQIIPFIPGTTDVTVIGDIVRYTGRRR
jgi:hypothetical protein